MNVIMILAGGVGNRVGADVPKQFVEVLGKPILAYTIELYQKNRNIDAIEIVCHSDWIEQTKKIIERYGYDKVRWITSGGETAQTSTMSGIARLKGELKEDDILMITMGVSPLTPQADIDDAIQVCKQYGNAVPGGKITMHTCITEDQKSSIREINRANIRGYAVPFGFRFGDICEAYDEVLKRDDKDELMQLHAPSIYIALGKRLWFSECTTSNVKITYSEDIEMFEALLRFRQFQKKMGEEQ